VAGSITVTDYDVAAGRMNLAFNNVVIPMNQGAGQCTINGTLATTGLSQ
jgi:autotransporter translocation and assembly factor TamB